MPGGPGITLKQVYIPGLVHDFEWDNWQRQRQVRTQFGLYGSTVVDGLRNERLFVCPMKLYNNFSSVQQLESFLLEVEGYIGQSGTFYYVDLSGNTVRQFGNTEFFDFVRGITRFDSLLGQWMDCKVVMKQLNPVIPADQQSLNDPTQQG